MIDEPDYRVAVNEDWTRLTEDFEELNKQEFLLLLQVWNATGGERALRSSINMCCCCTHDPTRPTSSRQSVN